MLFFLFKLQNIIHLCKLGSHVFCQDIRSAAENIDLMKDLSNNVKITQYIANVDPNLIVGM